MSNSILSDQELRNLLKSVIIDGGEDSSLTENFIEMERKFAFSAAPLIPVPAGMEQQLLSQLNHTAVLTKAAGKIGMKWLFTGLGSVCVATAGVVTYTQLSQQPPKMPETAIAAPLPQSDDTTKTAEMPLPETSIPVHTPSTFSIPVTEQALNLEPLSPQLPTPVSSSISYSFAGGERETAVRGTYRLAPLSPLTVILPQLHVVVPPAPDFRRLTEEAEQFTRPEMPGRDEEETLVAIDTVFRGVKRIELNIGVGDIEVHAGNGNEVKLSGTSDELQYELEGGKLNISSTPTGKKCNNEVKISKTSDELQYELGGGKLKISNTTTGKKCNIVRFNRDDEEFRGLHLEVPHGTELVLNTGFGNITVADVKNASCEANCSFGDVSVSRMDGPVTVNSSTGEIYLDEIRAKVHVTASFGDVNISRITGPVTVGVSSGDLHASGLNGMNDLQSDFGDVMLRNISGQLTVNANSGNLVIDSVDVSRCLISSNFGDVSLTDVKAPDITLTANSGRFTARNIRANMHVESSFGDAELTNVTGNLVLHGNSGNVTVDHLNGDIEIDTQFGDLTVLDSKGSANLSVNSGNLESKNLELTGPMIVSLGFGDGKIGLKNDIDDLSFDVEASFGIVKINKGNTKIERENGSILREKGPISVKGNASSGNITFN